MAKYAGDLAGEASNIAAVAPTLTLETGHSRRKLYVRFSEGEASLDSARDRGR